MFGPKENILNIHSVEDIFDRLDEVCKNEKNYTDEEFAAKIHQIYDFCGGGESGADFYLVTHRWSERISEERAKKYCKKHKIKLEDYKGVLPYRMFLIDTFKGDDNTSDWYPSKINRWLTDSLKKDTLIPKSRNDIK
jgi:hypothetical protein